MKQTQLPFLLSSMAAFAMVGGGLSPLALAAQNSDKLQLVQTGPGNLAKTNIYGARKINDHAVELLNERGQKITIDFYGPNIFRYFQDSVSKSPLPSPRPTSSWSNPARRPARCSSSLPTATTPSPQRLWR